MVVEDMGLHISTKALRMSFFFSGLVAMPLPLSLAWLLPLWRVSCSCLVPLATGAPLIRAIAGNES